MQTMKKEVIKFWFEDVPAEKRFAKDEALDQEIKEKFEELYWQLAACEHPDWQDSAEGSLASIIVLDQFSRNIFRGSPQAFALDPLALNIAQYAIKKGFDQELNPEKRSFLYMPFMHSESKKIHEAALKLFESLGRELNLKYEIKHKEIIDRFGRYPHRNEVLGRTSTPEEKEFLKTHKGF